MARSLVLAVMLVALALSWSSRANAQEGFITGKLFLLFCLADACRFPCLFSFVLSLMVEKHEIVVSVFPATGILEYTSCIFRRTAAVLSSCASRRSHLLVTLCDVIGKCGRRCGQELSDSRRKM